MDRDLDRLVREALAEDRAEDDVTTTALVGDDQSGRAVVKVKGTGVLSGHRAAAAVFAALDAGLVYRPGRNDGERVAPGDTAATIEGRLRPILAGERTALNFLGRLSGVATLAARFVEAVAGTGTTILDTRKTTPGLRRLEKEAVLHGGGANHRGDLSSMILVKENHIAAAGGFAAVFDRLGDRLAEAEIEVRGLAELRMLRERPPARVMLDNFDPPAIVEALQETASWPRRPAIEVSGGITLDNIGRYAGAGVEYISIGSLTAAAPSLDLSLILEEAE